MQIIGIFAVLSTTVLPIIMTGLCVYTMYEEQEINPYLLGLIILNLVVFCVSVVIGILG
jgi:hypothetical protein